MIWRQEKPKKATGRSLRVPILAALAMTAFAANSVIARLAMGDNGIDPGTFTLFRLLAGALVLASIVRISSARIGRNWKVGGSWSSATLLLAYAAMFSYAYVNLGAATGALLLFAVVQTVTFTAAVRAGEEVGFAGVAGLILAVIGMVALVGPGVSRPDPVGVLLMCVAGIAWAGYTLRGRGGERPVFVTAGNFLRSVPLVLAFRLLVLNFHGGAVVISAKGIALAILSGAVASGLGYALWYTILPSLTRAQSGIVQMAPAPIATLGGLALLGEPITAKILLASILILSGVLLGVWRPRRKTLDESLRNTQPSRRRLY